MSELRNWTIYKLTSPMGKVYVGKSCNLKSRMANYKYQVGNCHQQKILFNSLKKYGFQNHKLEILDTFNSTLDYASGKEIFWIKTYMSNISKWRDGDGMNLTDGGEGALGAVWTAESREKLSKSQKGKIVSSETRAKLSEYNKANPSRGMLGKNHSKEVKDQMSRNRKGKPNLKLRGYKHTEEVKRKSSESRKGKPSPNKGKSIWSELERKRIGDSKKGNTYTKGMKFSDDVKNKIRTWAIRHHGKAIIQYSANGEFIKEFPAIRVAATETGITRDRIKSSLNNPNTQFKDFIFKYKS